MMRRSRKIKWFPFSTGKSKYEITTARTNIAGVENRRVVELTTRPGEVYLLADLHIRKIQQQQGRGVGDSSLSMFAYMARKSYSLPSYRAVILIDVHRDRWTYTCDGKVVNWPVRFNFTVTQRDQILARAEDMIAKLVNDEQATQMD